MKALSIVYTCAIAATMLATSVANAQIKWATPQTMAPGDQRDKMYYFRVGGSPQCREVEEDVWSDQRVIQAASGFQAIAVDSGKAENGNILQTMKVNFVPTVLIVKGDKIDRRLERSSSRDEYIQFLTGQPVTQNTQTAPPDNPTSSSKISTKDSETDAPEAHLNIVEVMTGQTDDAINLTIKLAGPPKADFMGAYSTFFNIDNSDQTGYSGGKLPGADFLLQGELIYKFTGATTAEWTWQQTSNTNYTINGNTVSYAVPKSKIGSAENSNVKLWIGTQNQNWEPADWAPETTPISLGASASAPPQPQTNAASSTLNYTDAKGDASSNEDIVGASVDIVGPNLIVDIEVAGALNLSGIHLFLDSDFTPSTGYSDGIHHGGDFMIEGANVYKHGDSAGATWKWDQIMTMQPSTTGNRVRYTIPRSRTGIETSKPFSFWISTTDSNWNAVDYYPDSSNMKFVKE